MNGSQQVVLQMLSFGIGGAYVTLAAGNAGCRAATLHDISTMWKRFPELYHRKRSEEIETARSIGRRYPASVHILDIKAEDVVPQWEFLHGFLHHYLLSTHLSMRRCRASICRNHRELCSQNSQLKVRDLFGRPENSSRRFPASLHRAVPSSVVMDMQLTSLWNYWTSKSAAFHTIAKSSDCGGKQFDDHRHSRRISAGLGEHLALSSHRLTCENPKQPSFLPSQSPRAQMYACMS